jgi:hypothetical protein
MTKFPHTNHPVPARGVDSKQGLIRASKFGHRREKHH